MNYEGKMKYVSVISGCISGLTPRGINFAVKLRCGCLVRAGITQQRCAHQSRRVEEPGASGTKGK